MKSMLFYSVIALLIGSAMFLACSNNKEAESKKGTIEAITDKTAQEVTRRILSPIEKARSVKKQHEDRLSDMDKTLKDQ